MQPAALRSLSGLPLHTRRLFWSVLHNNVCLDIPSHQRAYQVLTTWASPMVARLGPATPAMNTKAFNIDSGGYSDSRVIRRKSLCLPFRSPRSSQARSLTGALGGSS